MDSKLVSTILGSLENSLRYSYVEQQRVNDEIFLHLIKDFNDLKELIQPRNLPSTSTDQYEAVHKQLDEVLYYLWEKSTSKDSEKWLNFYRSASIIVGVFGCNMFTKDLKKLFSFFMIHELIIAPYLAKKLTEELHSEHSIRNTEPIKLDLGKLNLIEKIEEIHSYVKIKNESKDAAEIISIIANLLNCAGAMGALYLPEERQKTYGLFIKSIISIFSHNIGQFIYTYTVKTYEDLKNFDFASLYPDIIASFHLLLIPGSYSPSDATVSHFLAAQETQVSKLSHLTPDESNTIPDNYVTDGLQEILHTSNEVCNASELVALNFELRCSILNPIP